VTALSAVVNTATLVVLVVLVSLILEVPVVQVFVPIGTVVVSLSFAIGSALSNIVSSLIFVASRPYDVGDRVAVSCAFPDETLLVRRVDVLSTTFLRVTNRQVQVPNWVLLSSNIENFRRSPLAVMRLELVVSVTTSAGQLEGMRRRVNAYLETQPLSWKPACTIRASMLRDQSIVLTLWASSRFPWQDTPKLFKATFALWLHVLAAARELGISFRAPDQSLRIEGTIATTGAGTAGTGTGTGTGSGTGSGTTGSAPVPTPAPAPTPTPAPPTSSVPAATTSPLVPVVMMLPPSLAAAFQAASTATVMPATAPVDAAR
jgi:small-conductance mechanosensitive channel